MNQTVKLQYFKESGKYYSSGEYTTDKKHIYDVASEVRDLKDHPGLTNRWNGDILIYFQELPHLIRGSK